MARRGKPSLDELAQEVRSGRHVDLTWEMMRHLYFPGESDRAARAALYAWAARHRIRADLKPRLTGPVMVEWVDVSPP